MQCIPTRLVPARARAMIGVGLFIFLSSAALPNSESQPTLFESVLRHQPGSIVVTLKRGQPLASAVDLSCFWPFIPGTTADAARRWYGSPAAVKRDHAGTYYEYRLRGIRVELADNIARTTFGSARWWSLVCYPEAKSALVFRKELAALVEGDSGTTHVAVFGPEPEGCDVVHASLVNGVVKSMDWNPRGCTATQTPPSVGGIRWLELLFAGLLFAGVGILAWFFYRRRHGWAAREAHRVAP
jgi:hypothetical protein